MAVAMHFLRPGIAARSGVDLRLCRRGPCRHTRLSSEGCRSRCDPVAGCVASMSHTAPRLVSLECAPFGISIAVRSEVVSLGVGWRSLIRCRSQRSGPRGKNSLFFVSRTSSGSIRHGGYGIRQPSLSRIGDPSCTGPTEQQAKGHWDISSPASWRF